jgi:hypothetical protein
VRVIIPKDQGRVTTEPTNPYIGINQQVLRKKSIFDWGESYWLFYMVYAYTMAKTLYFSLGSGHFLTNCTAEKGTENK